MDNLPKTESQIPTLKNAHPSTVNAQPQEVKKTLTGLKIPSGIDALRGQNYASKNIISPEKNIEEVKENQNISISADVFEKNLQLLYPFLATKGEDTLQSILTLAKHSLAYNKWNLTVSSELHKQMLDNKKDTCILFMREKLNVADLFWEVTVDASLIPSQLQPFTQQEKIQEMVRKNPNILMLQEIFKTRIVD